MISSVAVLFLYHDARVGMSMIVVIINLNQVFSTLINLFVLLKSSLKSLFYYIKNMVMTFIRAFDISVLLITSEQDA